MNSTNATARRKGRRLSGAGSIPSRLVDRVRIRQLLALCAALLVAASLAACGGDSDSTSTTAETATTSTAPEQQGNPQRSGGAREENASTQGNRESGGQGGNEQAAKQGSGSSDSGNVATPLKVSGGGAEQFTAKGGDNSVQEFGEEKDESELREAAEAVHSFFVARAEGRWADACSYLSKTMVEQFEQLAAESEKKGCASFLSSFTSDLPASVWRQTTTIDAGSLRQEGDQAFLIYYGAPEKTVYAMPLAYEDGKWKVGALSGDALPGA